MAHHMRESFSRSCDFPRGGGELQSCVTNATERDDMKLVIVFVPGNVRLFENSHFSVRIARNTL